MPLCPLFRVQRSGQRLLLTHRDRSAYPPRAFLINSSAGKFGSSPRKLPIRTPREFVVRLFNCFDFDDVPDRERATRATVPPKASRHQNGPVPVFSHAFFVIGRKINSDRLSNVSSNSVPLIPWRLETFCRRPRTDPIASMFPGRTGKWNDSPIRRALRNYQDIRAVRPEYHALATVQFNYLRQRSCRLSHLARQLVNRSGGKKSVGT